jgi:pimeloyl-ACP methyl ester carboxylesterase
MKILEQRIKLPNITLNVAIAGNLDGKPILLLHGYPDAWFGWEKVMKDLTKHDFRIIAPDQRGYNLSDKPKGVKAYYTQNLVQDAIDLMTHFGYDKFDLAGHDYGGYVAWIMALQFPNKVRKLLIISGLHPSILQNAKDLGWQQMIKSWYLIFFRLKKIPEWLLKKNHFKLLHDNHSFSLNAASRERYTAAWSQANSIESMINYYRVPPIKIENPFLKMPVLIIWGEKDLYLTTKAAYASLKYCPKGKLQIIKNASHWLILEETDRVVKEMVDFFK